MMRMRGEELREKILRSREKLPNHHNAISTSMPGRNYLEHFSPCLFTGWHLPAPTYVCDAAVCPRTKEKKWTLYRDCNVINTYHYVVAAARWRFERDTENSSVELLVEDVEAAKHATASVTTVYNQPRFDVFRLHVRKYDK